MAVEQSGGSSVRIRTGLLQPLFRFIDVGIDAKSENIRLKYNAYLVHVFGSAGAIGDLDHAILKYNAVISDLRLRSYSAKPFLTPVLQNSAESVQEKAAIVRIFQSCGFFLQSFLEYQSIFESALLQDKSRKNSIFSWFWHWWSGIEYNLEAQKSQEKFNKEISEGCVLLSKWIIVFIDSNPDLQIDDFFQLHKVLQALKSAVWKKRAEDCSYDFGEIDSEDSVFNGVSFRRELFFKVMLRDKKMQSDLEALPLEFKSESSNNLFHKIQKTALDISSEMEWMREKISTLNVIFQAKTKHLFQQRLSKYQSFLNKICKRKVSYFISFFLISEGDAEKFKILSQSLPVVVVRKMRQLKHVFFKKSYYSKTTENWIIETTKELNRYAGVSENSNIENLVKKYRSDSVYYSKKEITQFLMNQKFWTIQLQKESRAHLDEMLNVTKSTIQVSIESYFSLAQDLITDAFCTSTEEGLALEKIMEILREKHISMSENQLKKLQKFHDVSKIIQKLPKTEETLFEHMGNILKISGNPLKIFQMVEKYYLSVKKILSDTAFHFQENKKFLQHRDFFISILYKKIMLVPEKDRFEFYQCEMVKDFLTISRNHILSIKLQQELPTLIPSTMH